ncbi:cobalamin biosynthesis protein CobW [Chitiniphilus shinanonensis]|uniref:Cobalamin biosynthesis protein CobW n=1 Tax=Chitiniphilus shinanonensis TaxID=553088 RepID=A0ABQ6BU36_9NEIS|nr:CobW family GTP-binding protein [Chitiniphilus shinanonensis]GLS04061.1 cobalamin biosynthesis protein CobW [Chitiniphilus shinanonensis]
MTDLPKIPVNLVTGFLGVGKTSALTRLLADKPADQYWAVVVNEFGEIGIDGATLSAAGSNLNVAEVPGGCICCTTSPMLRTALTRLVHARRPDRILIEPSGLGHPAGIVDLLRDPMLAKAFSLRAVVTLVDPRHLDDTRYTTHQTWRDQLELADVLVLNKTDLADAEQLARARRMGEALFPEKLAIVEAVNGAFDPALLDLALDARRWGDTVQRPAGHGLTPPRRASTAEPEPAPAYPWRKTQSSLDSHSCGWVFDPETMFVSYQLAELFEAFNQPEHFGLAGLTRAKGVFHTERDWYRFDWVDGMPAAAISAYRRDSRFEVIVQSATPPDWAALEAALFATRLDGAANLNP